VRSRFSKEICLVQGLGSFDGLEVTQSGPFGSVVEVGGFQFFGPLADFGKLFV